MKRIICVGLAALSIAGVTACGGTGANRDNQVRADLKSLLNNKFITFTSVPDCSHQSGNQFVCKVTGTSDGTVFSQVTDDGSSIYASGL